MDRTWNLSKLNHYYSKVFILYYAFDHTFAMFFLFQAWNLIRKYFYFGISLKVNGYYIYVFMLLICTRNLEELLYLFYFFMVICLGELWILMTHFIGKLLDRYTLWQGTKRVNHDITSNFHTNKTCHLIQNFNIINII